MKHNNSKRFDFLRITIAGTIALALLAFPIAYVFKLTRFHALCVGLLILSCFVVPAFSGLVFPRGREILGSMAGLLFGDLIRARRTAVQI